MNKKIIKYFIFLVIITILIIGIYFFNSRTIGWNKINIGRDYNTSETIELDLDGDDNKEKIEIKKEGKFLTINGEEYIVNKYCKDDTSTTGDYYLNLYHFVDLNNDGSIEIIHRTFSDRISPITNEYTIYNYRNNSLSEVGSFRIMGTIPNEVFVKKNIVKFEFHPYESRDGYTEKVIFEIKE